MMAVFRSRGEPAAISAAALLMGSLFGLLVFAHPFPAAAGEAGPGAGPVPSPVYYVDFENGDDNNDGLSKEKPWKHIPGTHVGSVQASPYVASDFGRGACVEGREKISAGAAIRLKSGTTLKASNGGGILINADFYEHGTAEKPIVIERDPSWGAGPVVFDAEGMPLGKWECQFSVLKTDHVWLKGNGKAGLVFRNSPREALGIHGKKDRKVTGAKVSDVLVSGFANCGLTAYWLDGFEVSSVELDGKGIAGNAGFHFGEWPCNNGVFRDCVAHDLGDKPGGQPGGTDVQIGFWLVNSQHVTYLNCTAYNNEGDGFDLGLCNATEANATDDIRYVNCLSYNNADGYGANAGEGLNHNCRYFYVNCIAHSNLSGFHAYGGTAEYTYAHCLAHNNRDGNFHVGPDGWKDRTKVTVRIWNSIGYKPDSARLFHKANLVTTYVKDSSFRLDSDHNFWAPRDPKVDVNFCYWDAYAGKAPYAKPYTYANGPGRKDGEWYKLDEHGHLNCDGNSLNGADGHAAGFANEEKREYRLTAASSLRGKGCDLTGKPWFLPEMALDRDGNKRTSWDIGPHEHMKPNP